MLKQQQNSSAAEITTEISQGELVLHHVLDQGFKSSNFTPSDIMHLGQVCKSLHQKVNTLWQANYEQTKEEYLEVLQHINQNPDLNAVKILLLSGDITTSEAVTLCDIMPQLPILQNVGRLKSINIYALLIRAKHRTVQELLDVINYIKQSKDPDIIFPYRDDEELSFAGWLLSFPSKIEYPALFKLPIVLLKYIGSIIYLISEHNIPLETIATLDPKKIHLLTYAKLKEISHAWVPLEKFLQLDYAVLEKFVASYFSAPNKNHIVATVFLFSGRLFDLDPKVIVSIIEHSQDICSSNIGCKIDSTGVLTCKSDIFNILSSANVEILNVLFSADNITTVLSLIDNNIQLKDLASLQPQTLQSLLHLLNHAEDPKQARSNLAYLLNEYGNISPEIAASYMITTPLKSVSSLINQFSLHSGTANKTQTQAPDSNPKDGPSKCNLM